MFSHFTHRCCWRTFSRVFWREPHNCRVWSFSTVWSTKHDRDDQHGTWNGYELTSSFPPSRPSFSSICPTLFMFFYYLLLDNLYLADTFNSDTLEECPASLDVRRRAEIIPKWVEKARREVECAKAGGLGTWRGRQDYTYPCNKTMHGSITAVTSKYNLQLTYKKMKEKATSVVLLRSFTNRSCRLWTSSSRQSKMLHATEQSEWTCQRWGWQMERSQCGTLAASLSTLSPTRCCSLLR